MASTIDDLELLLDITVGPVAGDPGSSPLGALDAGGTLGKPKILASSRTYGWGSLPRDVETAFDACLRILADDLGLEVNTIDPAQLFTEGNPDLDWFVLCCTEQAHLLGRDFITSNAEQLDPIFLKHMEYGLSITIEEYLSARRARFAYTQVLDQLLGEDTILVTPTVAVTGITPDGRMTPEAEPGIGPEAINTVIQNITGHPAISLPSGVLPNGVPFGLQLTGPRFSDRGLLALARKWQQAKPWPLAAPGYLPFSIETIASS
jgi:Asp-tRNA(Asn)/Glu-tRNA(Gln) amidotransferase A subunit family amidase